MVRPVSVAEAGLSVAERELIRAHRFEASALLARIARSAFHSSEYGRRWYTELTPENTVDPVPKAQVLEHERSRILARDQELEIETLLRGDSTEPGSPTNWQRIRELLAGAVRLVPGGTARFHLAVSHAASGDLRTAQRLLARGIGDGSLDQHRSLALVSLGITYVAEGDRLAGLEAYKEALAESPRSSMCLVSVAGTALCIGDTRAARDALERLELAKLDRAARMQLARQQARVWESSRERPLGPSSLFREAMTIDRTLQDVLLG